MVTSKNCSLPAAIDWTSPSAGDLFLHNGWMACRTCRAGFARRVQWRGVLGAKTRRSQRKPLALAVTIRTYLLQNAAPRLAIDDSSQRQRWRAARPTRARLRRIAAWSADLVLAGATVNYHSDQPGPARLSWKHAVEQAGQGLGYDSILAQAFPRSSLSRWDNPVAACQPLPAAEDWLRKQRRQWRERLDREPGYEEIPSFPCAAWLPGGPMSIASANASSSAACIPYRNAWTSPTNTCTWPSAPIPAARTKTISKAWPGACYWNDSMNRMSLAALLSCLPLVAWADNPVKLDTPVSGWRAGDGSAANYRQVVNYPASSVNVAADQATTARIRGAIESQPATARRRWW